jgi:FkbM family methyltransferase
MYLPKFIRKWRKQNAMLHFYKTYVGKDDLCFDIGANMGERADCFLKLGAKVIVVEPQNSCYTMLKNKYSNHPKVEVLKYAVGSTEREATLMICDETDECSTLSSEFVAVYSNVSGLNWGSKEKVEVVTLNALCQQYGIPKYCKIDVEGYESEVFMGLNIPIEWITFEFNRPLLHDTIKSLEVLSAIGNYQCNYIKYEFMKLALPEWMAIDEFRQNLEHIISPDILTGEIVVQYLGKPME